MDDLGIIDLRAAPQVGSRLVLSCMATPWVLLSNKKKAPMPVSKKKSFRITSVRSSATAVSLTNPKFHARFVKELRHWEGKVRPLKEAARSSERLTERDFAIRIKARRVLARSERHVPSKRSNSTPSGEHL